MSAAPNTIADEPVPQAGDELKDAAPASVPGIMSSSPIGKLPAHLEAGLELVRQHGQVSAALAAMTWGKGMTAITRRAVSSYCERWGLDPLTELDILGGNFYITSEFYIRKLGELREAGRVVDFWLEHIHNDERIGYTFRQDEHAPADVKEEARRLWYRNMLKRAEFNVPEAAGAACVCYIKLPGDGHLVAAAKWGGNGTSVLQPKRGGGKSPNPVVEDNPELAVESQAIRRAMRCVTSHVTGGLMLNQIEAELTLLNEEHGDEIAAAELRGKRARELERPEPAPRALTEGAAGDVYGMATSQEKDVVAVEKAPDVVGLNAIEEPRS